MSLLAAYYHSLEQENAAKADSDQSQSELTRQQSAQVGANAEAQRALQAAQGQSLGAGAAKTLADAAQVAPNAAAARAAEGASAGLDTARTMAVPGQSALTAAQTGLTAAQGRAAGFGLNPVDMSSFGGGLSSGGGTVPATAGSLSSPGSPAVNPNAPTTQGYETGGRVLSKGEAAIGKAKKPGPTDTVPVMLTPGEGVLNKGAMAHYGTDVVDKMNAMGLLRMGAQSEVAKAMGQPDPHAPPQTAKRAERKAKQQSRSKAA